MSRIQDVVGIGFGPSNLGLAIAVEEHNAAAAPGERLTAQFLERQRGFGWHRGMLIEDARMQVSFLKDLVTLRNPQSPHSFLAYLADRGRLVDFVNYQSFFPTRLEFHDYLDWVVAAVPADVSYDTEVQRVTRVDPNGCGPLLEVLATGPDGTVRHLARNVVVATGLQPHLPPGVVPGARIWHNRDLVPRVAALAAGPAPRRLTVVGAGQSAAEAVDYLHRSFPGAEVCAVFARYGYSPADDSGFANRVFDPAAAQEFFSAPEEVKQQIVGYHRNTNYSVVEPDLIRSLYDRHYAERVGGAERLRFHNLSEVTAVGTTGETVQVTVTSLVDGTRTTLDSDVLVYATGYRSGDPTRFLTDLACRRDAAGRPQVGLDYRLAVEGTAAGVYVQGATEHTHGIGSTLLSNVAVRSGDIVASVLSHRAARTPALIG